MTPDPARQRLDSLLTDLPRHLLWRLAERFQSWREKSDPDEEYVKWADVKAALLAATPSPTFHEVNAALGDGRSFLKHRPTCAADAFQGQGCDCGLRAFITRLLAATRAARPAETGTLLSLKNRDTAEGREFWDYIDCCVAEWERTKPEWKRKLEVASLPPSVAPAPSGWQQIKADVLRDRNRLANLLETETFHGAEYERGRLVSLNWVLSMIERCEPLPPAASSPTERP